MTAQVYLYLFRYNQYTLLLFTKTMYVHVEISTNTVYETVVAEMAGQFYIIRDCSGWNDSTIRFTEMAGQFYIIRDHSGWDDSTIRFTSI